MTNEIHSRVRALAASVLFTVSLTLLPLASASAAQATWSPETVLSAPNVNGATQIRVANNASGISAVVWDERVDYYTTHLYVSVNDGSGWTTAKRLTTSPTLYTSSAGAVVAPDGTVTVYWQEGAASYYTAFAAGAWTPSTPIPADPDFGLVAGAGVDKSGYVQFLMAALRVSGSFKSYDSEVLVKDPLGNWTAPTRLTTTPGGYPRLLMNSSGQALAIAGYTAWRSSSTGTWNPTPKAIPFMAGQTYATDAAIDASGNGYFVLYNRYGGMNLSTSTPTSNWTALRHLSKFDPLGSSLAITGGGAGGAMIYGVDYMTGKLRASVSTAAGKSWGTLYALDVVSTTQVDAAGGESNLFALAWDGKVTAGTGIGTKAAAWNTQVVAPDPGIGGVAVTADRVVTGWIRGTDASQTAWVTSARTGTIAP